MKVTGSLQIRNGKYHMFVRIPGPNGKVLQKAKTTGISARARTKKEERYNKSAAEAMLSNYLSELSRYSSYHGNTAFTKAIEDWLNRKQQDLRLDTFESYQCVYDAHIKPYFEPLRLSCEDVAPIDIKRYVVSKQKEGLSTKTIRKHLVVLNGPFKEAIELGELVSNPCASVSLKKKDDEEFEGSAYTTEQARELLEAIRGDPIEPAVYLGLYLGLRRSEVIGLRWKDIDFVNDIVSIRNTVVQFNTVSEDEKTKSKTSRRDLFLPRGLKEYLSSYRNDVEAFKKSCGISFSEESHVCEWKDGEPYKPAYISKHFKIVLEKAGLPHIRFHDLRHTAGSLLLMEGADIKQVQIFLGHKKASTTLDIYAHVLTDGKKDTAKKLDGLLTVS